MAEKEYKDSASRDGYIITLYTDNSSKIERLFIQRDTRKELEKIWRENSNGEPIPQLAATHNISERKFSIRSATESAKA